MALPRYRIIFIDLDGTCIGDSGVASPATVDAVRRAGIVGCRTVVCTGRTTYTARRGAGPLAETGYGIVLNGAATVDWVTGEPIRSAALCRSVAAAAITAARGLGLAAIAMGVEPTQRWLLVDDHAPLVARYEQANADRIRVVGDLAANLPCDPLSLSIYGTREQAEAVVSAWTTQLGPDARAFHSPTDYYGCWYAQLTAAGADKGIAAAHLAALLGVPREETMAIGDQLNDIGLLRWAGLGVCMGDGATDVRTCADEVTGCLSEEGAARAIERHVLRGA